MKIKLAVMLIVICLTARPTLSQETSVNHITVTGTAKVETPADQGQAPEPFSRRDRRKVWPLSIQTASANLTHLAEPAREMIPGLPAAILIQPDQDLLFFF